MFSDRITKIFGTSETEKVDDLISIPVVIIKINIRHKFRSMMPTELKKITRCGRSRNGKFAILIFTTFAK